MQQITIRNLVQRFFIGWTQAERSVPQELSFDIVLEFSFENCQKTGVLHDTVDYMDVMSLVRQMAQKGEWRLVECLSRDIASNLFDQLPLLDAVIVSLRKKVSSDCDCIECSSRYER